MHPGDAGDDASQDGPEAVDFDALHAALGDPLQMDDFPPDDEHDGSHEHGDEVAQVHFHDPHESHEPDGYDSHAPHGHDDEDTEDLGEQGEEHVGQSDGRSSAHYASSRPRTIPPSQLPSEDLNAPPVIVASEDTVPSAPPQMTVPLANRPVGHTPQSGVPIAHPSGALPPGSGRHPISGGQLVGQPASAPRLDTLPSPALTPAPHAAHAVPQFVGEPAFPRSASQMTVRMPDRPVLTAPPAGNPRRGKVETIVVRPRGPSAKQKLFAFMAMLLLVTACGIAVIVWRKPAWIGFEAAAPPATNVPATGQPVVQPIAPALTTAPAAGESAAAAASGPGSTLAPSTQASSTQVPASGAPVVPKPRPKPIAPPTNASVNR